MTGVIEVRDATAARWDDLVAVMGTRGDPSRCWCQWFRGSRTDFGAQDPQIRRAALQRQVGGSPPPGVLAYDGEEPVGWCAAAPRADYQRLATYRASSGTSDEEGLWSVTCFVVRVGHRRRGVAAVLLDGAVDLARRHGAAVVEAYPIDTSVRAASAAELYHGPLSVFLAGGFAEVDGARKTSARPVVRLALG